MCMAYIYNAYMLMYMLLYVSLIRISVINHITMLSRGVARVAASAAAVVMVKHLDCISSIVTWIQYPTDRVECLTCRQRLLRSCETESERETERVTEGDRERHTQSERDRHTTRDNKSHFTLLSSLLLVLRWSFFFYSRSRLLLLLSMRSDVVRFNRCSHSPLPFVWILTLCLSNLFYLSGCE